MLAPVNDPNRSALQVQKAYTGPSILNTIPSELILLVLAKLTLKDQCAAFQTCGSLNEFRAYCISREVVQYRNRFNWNLGLFATILETNSKLQVFENELAKYLYESERVQKRKDIDSAINKLREHIKATSLQEIKKTYPSVKDSYQKLVQAQLGAVGHISFQNICTKELMQRLVDSSEFPKNSSDEVAKMLLFLALISFVWKENENNQNVQKSKTMAVSLLGCENLQSYVKKLEKGSLELLLIQFINLSLLLLNERDPQDDHDLDEYEEEVIKKGDKVGINILEFPSNQDYVGYLYGRYKKENKTIDFVWSLIKIIPVSNNLNPDAQNQNVLDRDELPMNFYKGVTEQQIAVICSFLKHRISKIISNADKNSLIGKKLDVVLRNTIEFNRENYFRLIFRVTKEKKIFERILQKKMDESKRS